MPDFTISDDLGAVRYAALREVAEDLVDVLDRVDFLEHENERLRAEVKEYRDRQSEALKQSRQLAGSMMVAVLEDAIRPAPERKQQEV